MTLLVTEVERQGVTIRVLREVKRRPVSNAALPSREARLRQLVLRGVMPSVAERVVADAEAAGQRITPPNEAAWDGEVTPADIEQARLWWYYSVDVPTRLRRILDARVVSDAK